MAVRILIVEDDADLGELIAESLAGHEWRIETVEDLAAAAAAIRARRPELVLADVGLPDGSGVSIVEMAAGIPVVLMSADSEDARVIAGLEAGAVDFVPKPFSAQLLRARVQAALRQRARSINAEHRIGTFVFHPADRKLRRDDLTIVLTQRETDILKHLLAKGEVVDRRTLLKEVWGYSDRVSTHTVETHIYRLRQKMEADPRNPKLLVTDAGGYSLQTG